MYGVERGAQGVYGVDRGAQGVYGVDRGAEGVYRRGSLTVPITTATTACVRLLSETSNRLLNTGELEKTMPFEYH